jgi:CubicO group peptidase (beta-lactamase class C family)
VLGLAGASPIADALRRGKLDAADALIRAQVAAGRVRAATLHVRQGQFTFERAFGEARSPDALFLIASITKPMTAAGVIILADRGALALEDPVEKFIPEFTGGDRKLVTIRHLLTQGLAEPRGLGFSLRPGAFGSRSSSRAFATAVRPAPWPGPTQRPVSPP